MKHLIVAATLLSTAAFAQIQSPYRTCVPVGGVLFTNVGVMSGTGVTIPTNLGVVYGDLRGAVAATIVAPGPEANSYRVQHYWVTDTGDKILFKEALLKAIPAPDGKTVLVTYDNYKAEISGGTGKFENATGVIGCLGAVDFAENHLVLRYKGQVCYQNK